MMNENIRCMSSCFAVASFSFRLWMIFSTHQRLRDFLRDEAALADACEQDGPLALHARLHE